MYDKHLIVDDSLVRTDDGFRVDLRIPYYRGLGLSMVDIPQLRIDGRPVDLEGATFTVGGRTYPLSELHGVDDDRWGFTQAARIGVREPIEAGEHDVEAVIDLRISYMPTATVTTARKRLALRERGEGDDAAG